MDAQQNETIDAIVRIIQSSPSILFVTGAGLSADSGVPTYRGIGGMYDVDVTEEGLPIEQVLSGTMFQSNPLLTWKYLGQIAEAARGATFNRAHEVIAEMEQTLPRVWTLTQNVDGFHTLAGSHNVIEIHGSMRSLSCTGCAYRTKVDDPEQLDIPPYCPSCESLLRPDVVLFEEALPEAALQTLLNEAQHGFDLVIGIGTTGLFPYIQQPFLEAKQWGVPTVEINPDETLLSTTVDYRLALGAAEAMDEIWRRCQ